MKEEGENRKNCEGRSSIQKIKEDEVAWNGSWGILG